MTSGLKALYQRLYSYFGPQGWWPADSPFEVMVGAILTQNTNWGNVERAICNLKKAGLLVPYKLYSLAQNKLAALIRPAGYYNVKAKRLRNFLDFYIRNYRADLRKISARKMPGLRNELLMVSGIGPETADSILLYALNKPIFVVDAYTKRILSRHKFIRNDADYQDVQNLFMRDFKKNAHMYNEYHALLVKLGKEFCLKNKPRCEICPLRKNGSQSHQVTRSQV